MGISHLVQGGLGDGVVLYVELLLVGEHQLENARQRGGGDLVLQRVVVLLPLDTAREGALHEGLGRVQVREGTLLGCPDLHGDHIPITKPTGDTWNILR